MPIAAKLDHMLTYLDGVLPLKSHDTLIMWSSKSGDKLEPLNLHYHSAYDYQAWQDGDLHWGAPTH